MKLLSIKDLPQEFSQKMEIKDDGMVLNIDTPIEPDSFGKTIVVITKEQKYFTLVKYAIFSDESTWIYIDNPFKTIQFTDEPISIKYTSQNEVKFIDVSTLYAPTMSAQRDTPTVLKELKTKIYFMKSVPEEVIKQFNPEKGYAIIELNSIVDSLKDVKMILIKTDKNPVPSSIKSTFNFENKTWVYALISTHSAAAFKDEPVSIKYHVNSNSHFVPLSKVYL